MRTRAERRKNDYKKAIRKEKIDKAHRNDFDIVYGWALYDNLHQYSKNKVHCSCGMCSCKTKNKGRKRRVHANYYPSFNPSASDKRKIDRMNYRDE